MFQYRDLSSRIPANTTRRIETSLLYCWPTVCDAGTALTQQWLHMWCVLRCRYEFPMFVIRLWHWLNASDPNDDAHNTINDVSCGKKTNRSTRLYINNELLLMSPVVSPRCPSIIWNILQDLFSKHSNAWQCMPINAIHSNALQSSAKTISHTADLVINCKLGHGL